ASDAADEANEDGDDDDDDDDDFPTAPKSKAADEVDPDLARVGSGAELPEPKASDQEPGSVPSTGALAWVRSLEVGPLFGLTLRSADGDGLKYSPGFTWGAFAKSDVWPFLGLRASYQNSSHTIEGEGSINAADASRASIGAAHFPTVSSFSLRFSVEPTWTHQDLRVFGGLGIGWGKLRVEHVDDATDFHVTSKQAGVLVEYPLGIGASYDLLDGWLAVGALYTFSLHSNMTGSIYDTSRGTSQGGQRVDVSGLPTISSSQQLTLTLAALL